MTPSHADLPHTTAGTPDRERGRASDDDAQDAVRLVVRQTATQATREQGPHDLPYGAVPYGAAPAPEASPVLVALLGELRTTVWTYVWRRRTAGTPVQRVLPEVKVLVREALSREAATGAWFHEPGEVLMAQVVRWSIEAYYALHYEGSLDGREHSPN